MWNIARLANLAEIVGAVVVVVTLIYLAIQIRQNNRSIRSTVLQAVTSELGPLNLALASNESMRETWSLGLQSPEKLSESEQLQFNVTLHCWFSSAQNWYLQQNEGVLSVDIADGQWATMATMYHQFPGFKRYWEERRYLYTNKFQQFVENDVLTVSRQHLWNRFSAGLRECFCSS